jgi:uncharacterized protein
MTTFEWDESKRLANIEKHGIDFITATRVFDDAQAYTYRSSVSPEENRFVIVGMVEQVAMAVIYTERGEAIRLISVRIARREERARYGQGSIG